MKILHIGKYFPPHRGGMERYLKDLMIAQQRQGLRCQALVHRSDISLANDAVELNDTGGNILVRRAAVWLRLLFTPVSPLLPFLLQRAIREFRPDVLHVHLPNLSSTWVLLLPSARRIPLVIHWHSDIPASGKSKALGLFYRLYRPLERALLRHSRAIIVTSPPYLETSRPLQGFRDKCRVIPLGLPGDEITTHPLDDALPTRVLAVGRLTYYKGFEYLVRALAQCDDTVVHLVGSGSEEQALKALARQLDVADRIHFHGEVDDQALSEMYQTCHYLCLPSIERTEAFGMVLLEAMQQQRPALVTTVAGSGMTWVVDDGKTGVHCRQEDPQALADAMRTLGNDRAKLRRLGANAYAKFRRNFCIEQSERQLAQLYLGVCSTGEGTGKPGQP